MKKANPTPASPIRERINFDGDWRFHLGDLPNHPQAISVPEWRVLRLGKDKPTDLVPSLPKTSTESWDRKKPWEGAFNKEVGYAWFRAELPNIPGPHRSFHFTSISDEGDVYLNGKFLLHHEVWTDPFDVDLEGAWREGGPNHLAVLVKNGWGEGFVGDGDLNFPIPETSAQGPASPGFEDGSWRAIRLPHDFVVEGAFDQATNDPAHAYLPKGIGWYRKGFDLSEADRGRSLRIDFDGVSRNCRVWLNGRYLGRHKSGYTGFGFDLAPHAIYGGRNVLAVRADARGHEGWWYEGGGIYRHAWLTKAHPIHVDPWGVYIVALPKAGKASLSVETTLRNQTRLPASLKVLSEVQDAKGKTVLKLKSSRKLPKGGQKALLQKGRISKPTLWSPGNPYLYKLVTQVVSKGKVIDRVETPFGVRSVQLDSELGVLLNGTQVFLKGTCNHQDHAGVGVAVPDPLWAFRLEKLMEMGSNAYRCAHNPPAPEFLDQCDQVGMLVIDENRRLGDDPEVLGQLESMVRRDRNHPSVILWSLCNEEPHQGDALGLKRGKAMVKLVRGLDRTRPVTAAMNGGWAEGLTKVVDLQGFNYNIVQYDPFRAKHPKMPIFGSETASTVSTRGEYRNDLKKGYVSAYDVNHPEWAHPAEAAWRPIVERPHMAGTFIWTGFDYKGEPTPYDWPCVNSHFGILDACGFPKDNFWYYQGRWGAKPVLHLFPHWNWPGREGEEIDVWCHTNYDQVELFLNGKWMGLKETPREGHLEWKVRYQPGVLLAKAYRKGVLAAETKVETTGAAAKIRLKPWKDRLAADPGEVVPVTVEILDAQGRLVPTAENYMAFKVEGPGLVLGVGNGDPSSHEPDKAHSRRAFHGLCQVLLGSTGATGSVTLVVRSEGLEPVRAAFSQAPSRKPN